MQKEAFGKLYDLRDKVIQSNDQILIQDFRFLQVSDHFYYMSTKFFSDGEIHSYFNPYKTPYEAFINYMNVLSDFKIRVDAAVETGQDGEISRLSKILNEKEEIILKNEEEIEHLKRSLKNARTGKIQATPKSTGSKTKAPKTTGSKTLLQILLKDQHLSKKASKNCT